MVSLNICLHLFLKLNRDPFLYKDFYIFVQYSRTNKKVQKDKLCGLDLFESYHNLIDIFHLLVCGLKYGFIAR